MLAGCQLLASCELTAKRCAGTCARLMRLYYCARCALLPLAPTLMRLLVKLVVTVLVLALAQVLVRISAQVLVLIQ